MKITDLKCTVMGQNPVVRITTDKGIDGYAQAENSKPYLKPHVLFYREHILGEDPRDVERVMMRIRRFGYERTIETVRVARAEGIGAEELVDRLMSRAREFAGEEPQADDMTCVVVRVEG